MSNPFGKVQETYSKFTLYWKKPPKGYHVPYKEIFNYGVGGIGVYFAISLAAAGGLAVGNTLFGNVLGIEPLHLQLMNIIATVINFGLTAFRSYAFDNTRSKDGKFRPYIKYMGVPTVILSIAMIWMPYENMTYWQKFTVILIFYELLQVTFQFYQQAYTNLVRVMSPNTQERSNIIAIGSVLWSFAPSLYNLVIPILSDAFDYNGLLDIRVYRYFYPVLCIVGVVLGHIAYSGTKERIVQAKSHFNQVPFMTAVRAIVKNKNFWIISLAGWIGFLEGAANVILYWAFEYKEGVSSTMYGIAQTVVANSALWAMLISPLAIKFLGKKKVIIAVNLLNVIFLAALYVTYDNLLLLVVFLFLNRFVNTILDIVFPAVNADIRDEQQYNTGLRIDGMFGMVEYIGTVIGMFTGLVLPFIYEQNGLKSDYNVLYNDEIRYNLFEVLIIASVIGAVVNAIPYFFYDLTEDKQTGMVRVLRVRAMFEDFGNKALTPESLVEGVDIIKQAQADYALRETHVPGSLLKAAQAMPRGSSEEKKARKEAIKTARERERDIEISYYVVDELNKFSTTKMTHELTLAKSINNAGYEALYKFDENEMRNASQKHKEYLAEIKQNLREMQKEQEAKGLSRKEAKAICEKQGKLLRADAREEYEFYKEQYRSYKYVNKYYPNHDLKEPDYAALEQLDELPEETKEEARTKKQAIREANRMLTRYNLSAKAYLDAHKMITQQENYTHLEEIFAQYDEALRQAAENERLRIEEERREEEEKKAYEEELKRKREMEKKSKKK